MMIATLWLALATSAGVNASNAPILLDFHASWCGPCQEMRPAINQLKREGYPVRSFDIDQARATADRYRVNEVPTFVLVDPQGRELGRTKGVRPAGDLVGLFRKGQAQLARRANESETTPEKTRPQSEEDENSEATEDSDRPLPWPWQTVVRIKVYHPSHSVGFGSGTIIHSTPDESIILTCAHIFHIDGARQQPTPSKFPLKIAVDLFDGKLTGRKPAMVHPLETVAGEAVDYDFAGDVGLIRIRPGRRLPASPVVPADWQPRTKVEMTTLGCSEGNDATAWTTWITNPSVRGLIGNDRYEAIECAYAPKEGRSGGGLYTRDGYVAGVCDFKEPRGNHGLYAAPRTIHGLLDRNRLSFCYNPASKRTDGMLAQNRVNTRGSTKVRAQSGDTKMITMPPPEMLGVPIPALVADFDRAKGKAWQRAANRQAEPTSIANASAAGDGSHAESLVGAPRNGEHAVPVAAELEISPAVESDPFADDPADVASPAPTPSPVKSRKSVAWRAANPSANPQPN